METLEVRLESVDNLLKSAVVLPQMRLESAILQFRKIIELIVFGSLAMHD